MSSALHLSPQVQGASHCPSQVDQIEQGFDDDQVARAYVELPDGWGPARVIIVAWQAAGYDVAELRRFGSGPNLLLLNGQRPQHPIQP